VTNRCVDSYISGILSTMKKRFCYISATIFALVFALLSPVAAISQQFEPKVKPEVTIQRASGPIVIDGYLDEDAWSSAVYIDGFTETFPGDLVRPPHDTKVKLMYDDNYLYLGIIAYDNPSTIRSNLTDRDAIFNDDFVGIIIDTYGNGTWGYQLFYNPRGIQGDMRASGGDEDASFHIVQYSEGRVTDEGYVVEVAIPFSELRFPANFEQEWRVTFWRTRPRSSRERSSWAAISRDDPCFLCQLGTLKGISGVEPGKQLRLLPSLTVTQSGNRPTPDASIDNNKVEIQPSLGVSYNISSSVTAELTINPDFSQIESDAGQIDVNTTTALFFSERRPFFQEGSDLYSSRINQLYTRSVNSPIAAVKLIGRMSKANFAWLSAWDDQTPVIVPTEERSRVVQRSGSLVNVGRYKYSFGNDNDIGMIFTDRRYEEGGSGSTIGFDGRVRFTRTLSASYHLVASHTDEGDDPSLTERLGGSSAIHGKHTLAFDGESFTGTGIGVGIANNGRHFRSTLNYTQLSPEFRAHAGFINSNSQRNFSNNTSLVFYPSTPLIDELRLQHIGGMFYNWDGLQKDRFSMPSINMTLPGQTGVQIGYLWSTERFAGVRHSGIRRWEVNMMTSFSPAVSSGFSLEKGRFIARFARPAILGEGHQLDFYLRLTPFSQLEIRPSIAWEELNNPYTNEEFFSVYILRTRLNYQFTRELFLRVITEYNNGNGNFDIQPLLTYKINPFSVFYLGTNRLYSDWDGLSTTKLRDRQYFLKLQYLF
jgi:hypothetical protein